MILPKIAKFKIAVKLKFSGEHNVIAVVATPSAWDAKLKNAKSVQMAHSPNKHNNSVNPIIIMTECAACVFNIQLQYLSAVL